MPPYLKQTSEDIEQIGFFEPFVSFEFAKDPHLQGVVVVPGIQLQGQFLYAHLGF